MNWYYAVGDDRKGPVEEAEFQQLVTQGVIKADTLVWQDGMPEWKAYREVTAKSGTVGGRSVCDECGKFFGGGDLITLDGRQICGSCKPMVIQQMQEGSGSNYEAIRNEHIKHEASIQSVGLLYFLGGAIMALASLGFMVGGGEGFIIGLIVFAFAGVQFWTAVNLRKLKPAARVPTGILSGIGLIGFPVGTLINAYILYLVFSKKGTYIMSEEYAEVRERTPHIKYRTSIIVIILVVLMFLLIGLGMVAAFFAPTPPR